MSLMTPIRVAGEALDTLMPLHLVLDTEGHITHVGPTMAKVLAGRATVGERMLDIFELRRPREAEIYDLLRQGATGKVLLRLNDPFQTQFIGSAVSLPGRDGVLVNLSFGISIFDAVRNYHLAGSDFAPTDLTLELLYVAEANAAAMADSRALNERLHGAKERAESDALTDALTGLHNRRALDQRLHRLIERDLPFSLAHLDLDFFKHVNDTHGHAAGDEVLRAVARVLVEETREEDAVARVGGDEFVLLFVGLVDQERISSIAARIIRRLETPVMFKGEACRVSASIGLVRSTQYERPEANQLLSDADTALYASKTAGRARFTIFNPQIGVMEFGPKISGAFNSKPD
ncbi:diguanylate cyclase [Maritimibacter sp. UBA3975]|uniref:diguanylate cyclase domain-containing protein n=1 Tax=Maritimibacter sp. UBA3975 TaxID=1946833 RepID=UPI000C09C413|nr:diguanylate cyclase [Maritimibacter sp. UBA3975]MAM62831.1 GGDEF domain-containing protein [Maritimibacter sp.]|tara:strand:+ start:4688 stop:5731 length:1044 start_codon:yes stop_codon:yes gene_type:complete